MNKTITGIIGVTIGALSVFSFTNTDKTTTLQVNGFEPVAVKVERLNGGYHFVDSEGRGVLIQNPEDLEAWFEESDLNTQSWERQIKETVKAVNQNDPGLEHTEMINIENK